MPFIYGIAAYAVLATGADQSGIDPQVDKQFAIVKGPGHIIPNDPPVAAAVSGELSVAKCPGQISIDVQGDVKGYAATISTTEGRAVYTPANVAEIATTHDALFTGQGATIWTGNSLQRLKGMDKMVSVRFENASATDVLKWVSKQNVNFVANADTLPKSKITMNLNNVKLSEALEAMAEALGGSWQVKGTTLVFRNGFFSSFSSTMPSHNFKFTPAPNMKGLFDGKAFSYNLKDFQGKFDDKQWQQLKGLDGKTFKFDEKWMKDMKVLDGKYLQGLLKEHKIDDKQWQHLKGLDGKAYTLDGKYLQGLKDLKIDGKTFKFDEKAFKDLKGFDGKGYTFDNKAFQGLKGLKVLEGFKNGEFGKTMGFKKVDGPKLLKSLTQAQKDLMKKQGFLKMSDLTTEQKGMIFTDPKADLPKDFTFVIVIDDQKITIKK